MIRRFTITLHALFLFSSSCVYSQEVTYCEPYNDRFTVQQELLGRVGDYYWLAATSRVKAPRRMMGVVEERNFVIYDQRMNVANLISDPPYVASSVKEYLVTTNMHFDRLHLLSSGRKEMELRLQRYEPDGSITEPDRNIAVFPFTEPGNSFLLVRSEDQMRILLLGFEFLGGSALRLHALLFDQDWQLLSDKVYRHSFLTQPTIQDDFSGYPLEDFNSGPVKLANNGEWMMLSPSRMNHNYLLFHFSPTDTAVNWREVNLPGTSTMEDACVSIDNNTGEAYAGVLSTFHYSPLKNVEVVRYSMTKRIMEFDSSYRLNTLAGRKVRNDNLVKENFVALPGRGFLLMKEYGRPFEEDVETDDVDLGWDPAYLFASNDIPDPNAGPSPIKVRLPEPRYGYARYLSTANPKDHDRGDLSLYYFPAGRQDTSWSGMISEEQVTELNSPNLSYMVVPMQDKLFFLYNSFVHGEKMYASTTVIDKRGEMITDQGVLFWGLKHALNFQQSRQIGPDEVVIPYDIYINGNQYGKVGFALVRFGGQQSDQGSTSAR
jgi:hypothetical protein